MTGRDTTGISGILFDKDGTLFGYDASWGPINREVGRLASDDDPELAARLLDACGMDPVSGRVRADSLLAAGSTDELAEGLVAAGAPFEVEKLTVILDTLFTGAASQAVPVTDLPAFFTRLRERGFRIGIASSDNEKSIVETAARFGFSGLLDFVAGYDSGHGGKPGPGMVLAFCEKAGLPPEKVAVVGDNNHDLIMAETAGAGLRVAVLTGTGSRDTLSARADYCLDDITAIEALLPLAAGVR